MTSNLFTYDKQKVLQALRYHFINKPDIRVLLIIVNVFAIGAAVLFYLKKVSPTAFFTSTLVWLILMLLVWWFMPFSIYRGARTFKDNFVAQIDEEGFAIENDDTQKKWMWQSISFFMESPHFFHIYFNQNSFFLLPKSAFRMEDVNKVREYLKSNSTKK